MTPFCRDRVAQNTEYLKKKMSGYGKANSVASMRLVRKIETLDYGTAKPSSSQPHDLQLSQQNIDNKIPGASNTSKKPGSHPASKDKALVVETLSGSQNTVPPTRTPKTPARHVSQQTATPPVATINNGPSRTKSLGGSSQLSCEKTVLDKQTISCESGLAAQNSKIRTAKSLAWDNDLGKHDRPEAPELADSPAKNTRGRSRTCFSQRLSHRQAIKRSLFLSESDSE